MKKLLIGVFATAVLLAGCGGGETNDYVWKDGQNLSEEFVALLPDRPSLDEYKAWHVFENEEETRVFISGSGGCAGCVILMPQYFVVNNDTGTIVVEEFEDADLSYLFERGTIDGHYISEENEEEAIKVSLRTLICPDGTKVAFVKTPEESIWIFDLLTGEERKVATINEGSTVLEGDEAENMWTYLDTNLLFWNSDSEGLTIKAPHELIEADGADQHSFTEFPHFSSVDYSSLRSFDFDKDGMDEYIAYYKKELDEPVSTRYGKDTDWNGAFKVFQRKNHEWVVVYEDEGTVGKEGYGVYSLMDEDDFFSVVDGEVQITTTQDGSGSYRDSYILEWDGEEVVRKEVE